MNTSLAGRFVVTGVVLFCVVVGVFLKDTSLTFAADFLWGAVIAAAIVVLIAAWYRIWVWRVAGRKTDAWSLSDESAVAVRFPPELAIARLRTIAESAFPTATLAKDTNGDLLITMPGSWWIGNSVVRATARGIAEGAELRLDSESDKLVNNGVCRGMIGRLTSELARATFLDEQGVKQPFVIEQDAVQRPRLSKRPDA